MSIQNGAGIYVLLVDELGHNCVYCKRRMLPRTPIKDGQITPTRYPTLDHVIPIYLGGTNSLTNLVVACYECNHLKGNATIHFDAFEYNVARLFRTKQIKQFLVYPEKGDPSLYAIPKTQLLQLIGDTHERARVRV